MLIAAGGICFGIFSYIVTILFDVGSWNNSISQLLKQILIQELMRERIFSLTHMTFAVPATGFLQKAS